MDEIMENEVQVCKQVAGMQTRTRERRLIARNVRHILLGDSSQKPARVRPLDGCRALLMLSMSMQA